MVLFAKVIKIWKIGNYSRKSSVLDIVEDDVKLFYPNKINL